MFLSFLLALEKSTTDEKQFRATMHATLSGPMQP